MRFVRQERHRGSVTYKQRKLDHWLFSEPLGEKGNIYSVDYLTTGLKNKSHDSGGEDERDFFPPERLR